jgi:hypothetical protein
MAATSKLGQPSRVSTAMALLAVKGRSLAGGKEG